MITGDITREGLMEFARQLNGKTLETMIRRKPFRFCLDDRGFHYTPCSSGVQRIHRYKFVDRVIDRYNEKRSLNPKDYADISKNASYLLVLIKMYRDA